MDIQILDLVPDYRNTLDAYVLHTTCTHSDMTETHKCCHISGKDRELLMQYWLFFTQFLNDSYSGEKTLTTRVKDAANGLDLVDGLESFKLVVPYDIHELGTMAKLTNMYVRYWDNIGHEHYVDIITRDTR